MVKDMRVAVRQERIEHAHQPLAQQRPANDILSLIGNTPLLRMQRIGIEHRGVELFAKAEWANPGGSVKDRPALNIVLEAEGAGLMHPGKILVDSTSGNTGIAYAMICAAKQYRLK